MDFNSNSRIIAKLCYTKKIIINTDKNDNCYKVNVLCIYIKIK